MEFERKENQDFIFWDDKYQIFLDHKKGKQCLMLVLILTWL